MVNKGKIFVTGASGFIGGRMVEILHLTHFCQVRAGVRNWASCSRIGRFPVEIVKADLLNEVETNRALEGISSVIHCAYGPKGATVDGTRNLLRAALEKGVERVVHLSTTEVYGNASGEIDEQCFFTYTGDPYGDSKRKAEEVCLAFSDKGVPISILRLPIVYGPFGRNWTINIAKMLVTGGLGNLEGIGNGKCNLLYIDDLFRAIMLALQHKNAVNETFNINGPEVISWNEYFQRFNESLGLPELKKTKALAANVRTGIMTPIRFVGGYLRDNHMDLLKKIADKITLADETMRKIEKKLKATPSASGLRLFGRNATYNIDKARKVIGYEPKFTIEAGLAITTDWLKHQGILHNKP